MQHTTPKTNHDTHDTHDTQAHNHFWTQTHQRFQQYEQPNPQQPHPNPHHWTGEHIITTNPHEQHAIHLITGTTPHTINPNTTNLHQLTHNKLNTLITDHTTPTNLRTQATQLGMRIIDTTAFATNECEAPITEHYVRFGATATLQLLLPPTAPTKNTQLKLNKLTPMTFGDGVYCIRSPQGTGKTHMITTLAAVDEQKPIISISHLISLVRHIGNKLALRQYDDTNTWKEINENTTFDTEGKPQQNHKPITRLATTVQSLHKIIRNGKVPKYHTVIIDESEQVIRAFTREMQNKRMIVKVLKYLIKHAKRVILMDADLGTLTTNLIQKWRPNETPVIITNTPPNRPNRTLEILEDVNEPYRIILDCVKRKERIYVYSNSKTTANNIEAYLKSHAPHTKTLLITSETNREPQVRDYLDNHTHTNYDVIIASPAVTTGFSIDDPTIKRVIGFVLPNINTATDTIQAINRPRSATTIHLYITPQRANNPTDTESIKRKWTKSTIIERELAGIDMDTGEVGIQDDDYEFIYVNTKRIENPQLNNLREAITKLATKNGYQVTTKPKNPESTDKPAREARRKLKEQRAETLRNTETINKRTYDTLTKRHTRTNQETNMITKYETATAYGLLEELKTNPTTATETLINWSIWGPQIQKVDNLAITMFTPEHQWNTMTNDKNLRPDVRRLVIERELYTIARHTAGLTDQTIQHYMQHGALPQLPTYTKESPTMTAFKEFVREHYLTLRACVDLPRLKLLENMPIRFLGAILRRMGLKQHRVGRNEKGQYTLHRDTTELTLAIMTARLTVTHPGWNDVTNHVSGDDMVFDDGFTYFTEEMLT